MLRLGERLSELRQDKGLTHQELGEILCAGVSTISRYENGKYLPDAEALVVLADYLHVSIDYLLGRITSYISDDFLQQPVSEHKTIGNVLHTLIKITAGSSGGPRSDYSRYGNKSYDHPLSRCGLI